MVIYAEDKFLKRKQAAIEARGVSSKPLEKPAEFTPLQARLFLLFKENMKKKK